LVQDRETRQVVAYEIGDRSRATARKLWDKIPKDLKDNGLFIRMIGIAIKLLFQKGNTYVASRKKTPIISRGLMQPLEIDVVD
jgi:hypothetical protein